MKQSITTVATHIIPWENDTQITGRGLGLGIILTKKEGAMISVGDKIHVEMDELTVTSLKNLTTDHVVRAPFPPAPPETPR